MVLPEYPLKQGGITRNHVVDGRFGRLIAEDFGIATNVILTALERKPQKQTIRICAWAVGTDDPAGALLAWVGKHRRGRCRRPREIAPCPARNRRRHGRGQDIAAPRTVSPGPRRGYGLNAAGILAALERMAG